MRYTATIILKSGQSFSFNGETKWPLKRVLRELEKQWPDAKAVEVERV